METPILFSGPMVEAVLAGRKTQTRRVVKPQPPNWIDRYQPSASPLHWLPNGAFIKDSMGFLSGNPVEVRMNDAPVKCPYGKAGDTLWVRESHYQPKAKTSRCFQYLDGVQKTITGGGITMWGDKADIEKYIGTGNVTAETIGENRGKLIPSIHMPRIGSRINLLIKDIRVERVNDISEEDAQAEGVQPELYADMKPNGELYVGESVQYRAAFHELWDKINGKKYPWNSSPFVWVIDFERNTSE